MDITIRRGFLRALATGATLPTVSRCVSSRSESAGNSTKRTLADRLGSTHVGPNYTFSSHNVLNEGAKRLQKLDSRVIKVWFHRCDQKYPQHSDWPNEFDDMVHRAEHPYFRELFDRPFKTFILSAYREQPGDFGNHYFRTGISDSEYNAEIEAFYDITRYLLETYDGTGKEFILQHWQGDWAIIGSYDRSEQPTQTAIDGMIRWLNARQEGVANARREVESDATVLHAAEVNIVLRAMNDGEPRVVNEVLPETNVDLVSHNSYAEMFRGFVPPNPNNKPSESTHSPPEQVELMKQALDYVNENTPEPSKYVRESLVDPSKNVFLGEYGFPEVTKGTKSQTLQSRRMTEVALNWGAPWVVYWQLYDNEDAGFWLVRDDETKTPTYELFDKYISSNQVPDVPTYVRLEFEWGSQIDNRAFACSEIQLSDSETDYTFDVGTPLEEPIFWDGCYWVEDGGEGPMRWFGGDQARTTIFIREEVFGECDILRLRGYPKTGGISVGLSVDGKEVERLELEERRWNWWVFTTTMTEENATKTESATASLNKTSRTSSKPTKVEQTRDEKMTSRTTSTSADGFGAVSTIAGVGLISHFLRTDDHKSE